MDHNKMGLNLFAGAAAGWAVLPHRDGHLAAGCGAAAGCCAAGCLHHGAHRLALHPHVRALVPLHNNYRMTTTIALYVSRICERSVGL